jgi:transcriptional regulator with PAS, ATPase and Fis domain
VHAWAEASRGTAFKALKCQLQETVEQQRGTSNDLQNILNSTNVATLFLDAKLNIRFFTPAAKSLFNIIASDVGRPLAHLTRRFEDADLLSDAQAVLSSRAPVRREVKAYDGAWFIRGMLPFQSDDSGIEGVVITFAGISEMKATEREIEAGPGVSRQHHRHHSPTSGRSGRATARHFRLKLIPSHIFGQTRGARWTTPSGCRRSS